MIAQGPSNLPGPFFLPAIDRGGRLVASQKTDT